MIIGAAVQQPNDYLDYDIDCSPMFGGNTDTLTNVSATVSPEGPTVVGVVSDANTAKIWFGGGTDGVTYIVEVLLTSDGGRIKEEELEITIEEFE